MSFKSLMTLVFVCLISTTALAAEKQTVCVKYKKGFEWSKGYKVTATILSGRELNSATNSYDYPSFKDFAVIFWGDDEATILQLNSKYISAFSQEVEDQYGKLWDISSGSGMCY